MVELYPILDEHTYFTGRGGDTLLTLTFQKEKKISKENYKRFFPSYLTFLAFRTFLTRFSDLAFPST